jgi:Calx-beta domain/RTX calcium-binding nonapeptide repeat (4 copies)/von Willebrand factor type A domain
VTSFTVTVPTFDDALDEANETYNLTIGGVTGVGTINDNDPTPSLSITGPTTVTETAGNVTYTVTLSAASGQTVTVNYVAASGTATSGSDFTATSGTLTFAVGSTVATFVVPVINDATPEGNESYSVSISAPSNAILGAASVTTTINANDNPPVATGDNNTGLEDAASIPVVLTGTDSDGTVSSFNLSTLPTNGALYTDAALTMLAVTGTDYAATGNARTFYFKPAADFNSSSNAGSIVPSFNFTAKDNDGLVSTSSTETITVSAVNDGTPVAVVDAYQTLVGSTITFTRAQLLANDTLFDHAQILSTTALPAGLSYNAGTQTYTYSPTVATAGATFNYTLTDDDGQTSTATVTLKAYPGVDDLATVSESALTGGTGGGVSVVSGNLFTNDVSPSTLSGNITGITNAGIISNSVVAGTQHLITTATGNLLVDYATGAYTYTLIKNIDNDNTPGPVPAGISNVTVNDALQTFVYTRAVGGSANLQISIADDRPVVENSVTEVTVVTQPAYNLYFMIDVSGSMTRPDASGDQRLVDANGNATIVSGPATTTGNQTSMTGGPTFNSATLGTSTLNQTWSAVRSMISKYFDEATNVSVELGIFSTGARYDNVAYTTKASALAALDALTDVGGGTNYSAGLTALQQMVGPVANPNDGVQRIVYFMTDGAPSVGGTGTINNAGANITSDASDPGVSSGYQAFANTNKIQTYAVALGPAVPTTGITALNNVHNVDADASDVEGGAVNNGKDTTLLVSDISKLAQVLDSTLPPSIGGSIGGAGATSVKLGADGGNTQFIDILLDSADPDTTPDTLVRFTYDGTQITNNNNAVGGASIVGNALLLDATRGFTKGTLSFNFTTGEYTYVPQGSVVVGEEIVIGFGVIDADGDTASATNTIRIVDGKPIAVDDFDTYAPSAAAAATKFFEGNVLNAVGTDGGGTQVAGFKTGASGEDFIIDGADVTSIVFKGQTFNLTAASSGTVAGGNYTINASGELTWTSTTEAANVLTFHRDGYYKYTPPISQTVTPGQGATVTSTFVVSAADATSKGITLGAYTRTANLDGAPNSTVDFSSGTGAAVNSGTGAANRVDSLENFSIMFNRATYPQGVQNVSINIASMLLGNNNAGGIGAAQFSVYDIAGNLLGQFVFSPASNVAATGISTATVPIPPQYSNIGRILIQPNSTNLTGPAVAGSLTVAGATFNPVTVAATAVIPDEVIQYTITDKDVLSAPDSSTANLTLHVVTNEYVGTAVNDTQAGSASNDLISGLAGDDTLTGLAGNDIIRGGLGNDSIDGGTDDDQLYGGDGLDTIVGGTGNDLIYGEAGSDNLQGGDGNDAIRGGSGGDAIVGGIGADIIIGGSGNDILTGGTGAIGVDTTGVDTFKWELADKGAVGAPASDIVTDFNVAAVASGGDVIDLRDLLVGENHTVGTGNLASFLHFEKVGVDTVIHVSSVGAFAAGFDVTKDVQVITLQNVDLVSGFANDQLIISDLLTKNKLITD